MGSGDIAFLQSVLTMAENDWSGVGTDFKMFAVVFAGILTEF